MISWHLRNRPAWSGRQSARRGGPAIAANGGSRRARPAVRLRAGTDLGKPRPATRRAAGQAGQPGAGTARRQPAAFPRHRRRLQPGLRQRPVRQLPGHPAPLAVAADAHLRLPHLPEPEGPGHHQAGVPRPRLLRLRGRPEPLLPRVGILRAVPRDQFRLRQPADGAGRHLLVPPRAESAHPGALRRLWRAPEPAELRQRALLPADPGAARATISTTGTWRARCSPAH